MRLNKITLAMVLVIVTVRVHEKAPASAKKLQVLTKDQIDPTRILKQEANLVHTRSAERFQQANWDNTNENPMLMINSDSTKSQIAAAKRKLQSAHFAAE